MGFWKVTNNIKHNMNHYRKYIPITLERLKNKNIVFFYETDSILNYIKSFCKTPNILFIKLPISELPTYELSKDLLNSCIKQDNKKLLKFCSKDQPNSEKGLNHYRREYLQSGEKAYREIISIWTSKVLLIEKIILLNPFNSEIFFWCDCAISKINYDITNINYNMDMINTNSSRKKYMGEKLKNAAGIMISSKSTWLKLIEIYKNKLNEIKHSNYAHDEETILYLIYKDYNSLFSNTVK